MNKKRTNKRLLSVILSIMLLVEPAVSATVYAAEPDRTPVIESMTDVSDSTEAPAENADENLEAPTENPGENTKAPAENPGENTEAPAENPGENTEAPAENTDGNTETPAENPDENAEAPTDDADASDSEELFQDPSEAIDQADENADEIGSPENVPADNEAPVKDDPADEAATSGEIPDSDNRLLLDEDFKAFEQDFSLSSAQINSKTSSQDMMNDFDKATEGVDYAADEVFYFADTEEEAQKIAAAFHGDLIFFEEGVALIHLNEYSVSEVFCASISSDTNVPVVYPNYYRYFDAVVPEQAEFSDVMQEAESANSEEFSEENAITASETELQEEQIILDAEQLTITEEITESEETSDSSGAAESLDETSDPIELGSLDDIPENIVSAYNDPFLKAQSGNFQWHHVVIGSADAWNLGYTGNGIKVAVLDTGVNSSHQDLNITSVQSMYSGQNGQDWNDHGTWVCGTIAARGNNNLGGVGVAPNASIYSYQVGDKNGSVIPDAYAIPGIRKAINAGVDVINMSFGGYFSNTVYDKVAEEAYQAGIILVASAGNEDTNAPSYPAAAKHVISVAATDRSNRRATFSTFGTTVDVSAPGVDIVTTDRSSSTAFDAVGGTSFSAPIVTGEVALILQAARTGALSDIPTNKSPQQADAVEKRLKKSAKSVGSGMGKGIPFLPKALNISYAAQAPAAPTITVTKSNDNLLYSVDLTAQLGSKIYYTTYYTAGGIKPTYYNSSPFSPSQSKKSYHITTIDTRSYYYQYYTVQAFTVNSAGVKSSIKKVTLKFKPLVAYIGIDGLSQIACGKSMTLKTYIFPQWASNKSLKWEVSSTPSDAVKDSVKVSGGKVSVSRNATPGTYTVKATSKANPNAYGTLSFTVIAKTYIKSIKFSKKNMTLKVGDSPNLMAATSPSVLTAMKEGDIAAGASDIKWSSSNTYVAYFSSGKLVASAPGTATITATANDGSGKKATVSVKVLQPVTSVSYDDEHYSPTQVAAGKSIQLRAKVRPANASNKKLKWSVATENASGLTVSSSGKVSTKSSTKPGSYAIKAEATDGSGKYYIFNITVTAVKINGISSLSVNGKPCKSTTIFRTSGNYGAKTSETFCATISGKGPYSTGYFNYTSSNYNVAYAGLSVSGDKLYITTYTGGSTGSAKITVFTTDGSNKKISFTVKAVNPASSLILGTPTNNGNWVVAGKSVKISSYFGTEFGKISSKKLTWSTNNYDPSLATIKNGKLTTSRKASGTITVTATATDGSGVTASRTIYINNDPVKSISCISFWNGWTYTNAKVGYYASSYLNVTGTCQTIHITSSNPNVASAYFGPDNGQYKVLVIFKKPGTAKITVKAIDGGAGKSTSFSFVVNK